MSMSSREQIETLTTIKSTEFVEFCCTSAHQIIEASLPNLRIRYGAKILQPFLHQIQVMSLLSSDQQPVVYLTNCLSPDHSVDQYLLGLSHRLEQECDTLIQRCSSRPLRRFTQSLTPASSCQVLRVLVREHH
jgi:hypothetical protein